MTLFRPRARDGLPGVPCLEQTSVAVVKQHGTRGTLAARKKSMRKRGRDLPILRCEVVFGSNAWSIYVEGLRVRPACLGRGAPRLRSDTGAERVETDANQLVVGAFAQTARKDLVACDRERSLDHEVRRSGRRSRSARSYETPSARRMTRRP